MQILRAETWMTPSDSRFLLCSWSGSTGGDGGASTSPRSLIGSLSLLLTGHLCNQVCGYPTGMWSEHPDQHPDLISSLNLQSLSDPPSGKHVSQNIWNQTNGKIPNNCRTRRRECDGVELLNQTKVKKDVCPSFTLK